MSSRPLAAKTVPISPFTHPPVPGTTSPSAFPDRKSTRLNSSHANISYAVFCLKKNKNINNTSSGLQLPVVSRHSLDQPTEQDVLCFGVSLDHSERDHRFLCRRYADHTSDLHYH